MKFLSGNILLCGMMLPLLLSCMSYDGELVTDSDGMTALSVRGYVYAGADAANASSAGGAVVSVTVFDRDDTECLCPLAEADAAASDDGYYEVRLLLRPDGDSVICVQAEMPDGGGQHQWHKEHLYMEIRSV